MTPRPVQRAQLRLLALRRGIVRDIGFVPDTFSSALLALFLALFLTNAFGRLAAISDCEDLIEPRPLIVGRVLFLERLEILPGRFAQLSRLDECLFQGRTLFRRFLKLEAGLLFRMRLELAHRFVQSSDALGVLFKIVGRLGLVRFAFGLLLGLCRKAISFLLRHLFGTGLLLIGETHLRF